MPSRKWSVIAELLQNGCAEKQNIHKSICGRPDSEKRKQVMPTAREKSLSQQQYDKKEISRQKGTSCAAAHATLAFIS